MKTLLPWFLLTFALGIEFADATRDMRKNWKHKMGQWGHNLAVKHLDKKNVKR